MSQGRSPSAVSDTNAVRATTSAQIGDASIAPSALTFGKMVDGGKAGKMAAEYRKVVGTTATTYNIPHKLGFLPAWCILVCCIEPEGTSTVLSASAYQYDKWTSSEVRVRVAASPGNQKGAIMWFLIGGER